LIADLVLTLAANGGAFAFIAAGLILLNLIIFMIGPRR
jgi:hypothetical protein